MTMNHTLQANPRHHKEETKIHNRNMTFRLPQSKATSPLLPCMMIAKLEKKHSTAAKTKQYLTKKNHKLWE